MAMLLARSIAGEPFPADAVALGVRPEVLSPARFR